MSCGSSAIDSAIAALAVMGRALGSTQTAKGTQLVLAAFDRLPPRPKANFAIVSAQKDLHLHGATDRQTFDWAMATLCDIRLAELASDSSVERIATIPALTGGSAERGAPDRRLTESIDDIACYLKQAGRVIAPEQVAAWTIEQQLEASDWAQLAWIELDMQLSQRTLPPEHVGALPLAEYAPEEPAPPSSLEIPPPPSGTEAEEEWAAAYAQTAATLVPPAGEMAVWFEVELPALPAEGRM